jgi:hypothetical protein
MFDLYMLWLLAGFFVGFIVGASHQRFFPQRKRWCGHTLKQEIDGFDWCLDCGAFRDRCVWPTLESDHPAGHYNGCNSGWHVPSREIQ